MPQAAAGGVDQLLAQWAAHLGAVVIGTVADEARAEFARAAGSRFAIHHPLEDGSGT